MKPALEAHRRAVAEEAFATIRNTYGVTLVDVLAPNRRAHVVQARRAWAKALRERGWSYPTIARAMQRDHTTVIHLCKERGWM